MNFTFQAAIRCSLTLCLVLGTSLALADDPGAAAVPVPTQATAASARANVMEQPLGGATRNLLNLQASNAAAAPARAGGGEEAGLVYHRYLDSFKHPIPAFFSSSTGKSSGASSGASN